MKRLRYVLCDVFTDRHLTGNALAVFTDARGLTEETMQALAREMNLAETVFVMKPEAKGHARIRIFTPQRELAFAGHPVLGAAFVLGGPLQATVVNLETGAGMVPVRIEREAATIVFGWMQQPLPKLVPFEHGDALLKVLGLGETRSPITQYDNGVQHVYVHAPSTDFVASLKPDFSAMAKLTSSCINVFAGSGRDYKTRMFAPTLGINEDAATGGAAGPLALHLAMHGHAPFGDEIRITQGAEIHRPSQLSACIHGNRDHVEQIEVGGPAVIIGRGEIGLKGW
jgi:trans-2,3-dihydro-3-hydroxyanthranilate isomerase